jgi:transcriptional regulator with XRE-family HTH domain
MTAPGAVSKTLAQNIRALMIARPILSSQAALARAASVDQRTVGRILNCEHAPTVLQVEKIAKAFGLAPWQLLSPHLDANDLPAHVLNESQNAAWLNIRIAAETLAKYRL